MLSEHSRSAAKGQLSVLLRTIMASQGLTGAKLAQKMGAHQCQVSGILTGRCTLTPALAKRLARALSGNEEMRLLLNQYGARSQGWDV